MLIPVFAGKKSTKKEDPSSLQIESTLLGTVKTTYEFNSESTIHFLVKTFLQNFFIYTRCIDLLLPCSHVRLPVPTRPLRRTTPALLCFHPHLPRPHLLAGGRRPSLPPPCVLLTHGKSPGACCGSSGVFFVKF